jgi:two-component system chemotaxis response regulator CheB
MESLPQTRLKRSFGAVVIGASAGGIAALGTILPALPATFAVPIVVVLHQHPGGSAGWPEYLGRQTALPVVEVEDKMPLSAGTIHCSPPGYHLLMEQDGSFALSDDAKVHYSRPSIDLLFASAADAFGPALIGVILTGANGDGAEGLAAIAARGGLAVVQSLQSSDWPTMPAAALQAVPQALVVDLDAIAATLIDLTSSLAQGSDE